MAPMAVPSPAPHAGYMNVNPNGFGVDPNWYGFMDFGANAGAAAQNNVNHAHPFAAHNPNFGPNSSHDVHSAVGNPFVNAAAPRGSDHNEDERAHTHFAAKWKFKKLGDKIEFSDFYSSVVDSLDEVDLKEPVVAGLEDALAGRSEPTWTPTTHQNRLLKKAKTATMTALKDGSSAKRIFGRDDHKLSFIEILIKLSKWGGLRGRVEQEEARHRAFSEAYEVGSVGGVEAFITHKKNLLLSCPNHVHPDLVWNNLKNIVLDLLPKPFAGVCETIRLSKEINDEQALIDHLRSWENKQQFEAEKRTVQTRTFLSEHGDFLSEKMKAKEEQAYIAGLTEGGGSAAPAPGSEEFTEDEYANDFTVIDDEGHAAFYISGDSDVNVERVLYSDQKNKGAGKRGTFTPGYYRKGGAPAAFNPKGKGKHGKNSSKGKHWGSSSSSSSWGGKGKTDKNNYHRSTPYGNGWQDNSWGNRGWNTAGTKGSGKRNKNGKPHHAFLVGASSYDVLNEHFEEDVGEDY
jgi:hypothetical protein